MKFTLFLGALAILVCFAQAQPVALEPQVLPQEQSQSVTPLVLPLEQHDQHAGLATLEGDDTPDSHSRQKRATCDLLSAWNINHTACAAHCLAMGKGFRGGYCNNKAVCVCRR